MTNLLKNKRGIAPIPTAILILVFSLFLSVFLYIAYVQIQTTVIRNAMKTGLANLAVTISEDTYTALRESDFEEYAAKLTGSTAYSQELKATYRRDVTSVVALSTADYNITALELNFIRDGKKIRYICTCDVTFQVAILGINLPATVKSVEIEGSHTAKYGR